MIEEANALHLQILSQEKKLAEEEELEIRAKTESKASSIKSNSRRSSFKSHDSPDESEDTGSLSETITDSSIITESETTYSKSGHFPKGYRLQMFTRLTVEQNVGKLC